MRFEGDLLFRDRHNVCGSPANERECDYQLRTNLRNDYTPDDPRARGDKMIYSVRQQESLGFLRASVME